jgi:hypothetical protein
MYKVKVVGQRSKLNEGRTCGLGFAFLKKEKEGEFVTVNTPSTCKDYLNDVVFIERYAKDKTINIFGLSYSYQNIFESNGVGYLFVRPLDAKHNADELHSRYDLKEEYDNFSKHIQFIKDTLNKFEKKMEFGTLTDVVPAQLEGAFVFITPAEWTDSPYMISLYALLIRSMTYVDFDNPLAPALGPASMDSGLVASARSKVDFLLKTKKLPEYPYEKHFRPDLPGGLYQYLHNDGLNSWNIQQSPLYGGMYMMSNKVIVKK